MPLLPRLSSKATSTAVARRDDPTLPAILEYQSPSTAIVNYPMPRSARGISWVVGAMVVSCFAAMGIIKVDKVRATETLRLNIGTASTLGTVTSARDTVAELDLKKPVVTQAGGRVAISRRIAERWRLIGSGLVR